MNQNKRLISLMLVFTLIFIYLAVPVHAEEPETFTVTYTQPNNASVTLSPAGEETISGSVHTHVYEEGVSVEVTVKAAAGYRLDSIKANGINMPNVNNQASFSHSFDTNTSLAILTKEAPKADIVVNEDDSFTYVLEGADESNKAKLDSLVTLKITPAENYSIKRILYNGSEVTPTGNNYTFTVKETNVFAVETEQTAAETKTLTVSVTGNGNVSPNGGTFDKGSEVELTFTPETGYVLSSLTVNGTSIPVSQVVSNKYSVVIDEDTVVTVVFVKTLTITATIGSGGSVTINGTQLNSSSTVNIAEGRDVTIRVSANHGFTIDSVKLDNATVTLDSNNSFVVNSINSNKKLEVSFKTTTARQYTITASSGPNGIISPSGDNAVEEGKDISFTITPDNGYEVDTVKVDGVVVALSGGQYKFTNVGANQNIYATFKQIQYIDDKDPISINDINWGSSDTINIDISKKTKVAAEVFQKITDECKNKKVVFTAENYKWTLPKGAEITIDSDYADLAVEFDGGLRYNEIRTYLYNRVEAIEFVLISYGNSLTFPRNTILSLKIGTDFKNQEVQQLVYNSEDKKLTNPLNSSGNEAYDVRSIDDEGWVSIYYYNNSDIVLCDVLEPYYTIVASAASGGSINPSGNRRVNVSGSVLFAISANDGYVINTLLVDGVEHTGASGEAYFEYPFDTVAADHTIHATFIPVDDYTPPTPIKSGNSTLIVSIIIIFLAVAGAAVLFIIKWRQEKY